MVPVEGMRAPIPEDEDFHLRALRRLGLLDTAPEERFDRVTRLAAAPFEVPSALVSVVDEDRQCEGEYYIASFGSLCGEDGSTNGSGTFEVGYVAYLWYF